MNREQDGTPIKIMIVDDDQDDRELLQFLFNKNEKFEIVAIFDNAVTLLEEITIKKNIPDILLMDLYMPVISGHEALAHLIKNNSAPKMATFIISGGSNPLTNQEQLDTNQVCFLKKPNTLEDKNDLPGVILERLKRKNNTKI